MPAEAMLFPGAIMSGLMRPSGKGPKDENGATLSMLGLICSRKILRCDEAAG